MRKVRKIGRGFRPVCKALVEGWKGKGLGVGQRQRWEVGLGRGGEEGEEGGDASRLYHIISGCPDEMR